MQYSLNMPEKSICIIDLEADFVKQISWLQRRDGDENTIWRPKRIALRPQTIYGAQTVARSLGNRLLLEYDF